MKRLYIITGVSKGIGKALAMHYADEFEVFGISRSDSSYTNYKGDISKPLDFSGHREYFESFDELILINCAGINYNSFAHKSEIEKWEEVIQTNLIGSFRVVREVVGLMRNKSFGRIINFSSVTSLKPTPGVSAYAASKSALWGLSKSFNQENARLNTTMNTINLGYTDLGMIKEVPKQYMDKIIADIPLGRLGNIKDIINTIDFCVETSYLAGAEIDLNGGMI